MTAERYTDVADPAKSLWPEMVLERDAARAALAAAEQENERLRATARRMQQSQLRYATFMRAEIDNLRAARATTGDAAPDEVAFLRESATSNEAALADALDALDRVRALCDEADRAPRTLWLWVADVRAALGDAPGSGDGAG